MALTGPTKPIPDSVGDLTEFLQEHVGDQLRSVVWYDPGDFEIIYAREEVMAAYSDDEVDKVLEELFMESLARSIKERVYAHGRLRCIVECFENGIEMHFIIGEGEGIAVGLEPAAIVDRDTFVGRCLEEVGLFQ